MTRFLKVDTIPEVLGLGLGLGLRLDMLDMLSKVKKNGRDMLGIRVMQYQNSLFSRVLTFLFKAVSFRGQSQAFNSTPHPCLQKHMSPYNM